MLDLDPNELNPMWIPAPRGAGPGAPPITCRIAARHASINRLFEVVPKERLRHTVTWDEPLALLADESPIADRVRAAGVPVRHPAGTYAERQWDAREALEEAAHRYFDHNEMAWGVRGMIVRQPHFAVVVAAGASDVTALLAALVSAPTAGGLIVDARAPQDLRVFEVEAIDRDRLIAVYEGQTVEHPRATAGPIVVPVLVRGAHPDGPAGPA